MTAVIDLDAHRRVPGIVWWTGLVRCTACGARHVSVHPMPDWAASPGSSQCPECKQLTCIPEETPQ